MVTLEPSEAMTLGVEVVSLRTPPDQELNSFIPRRIVVQALSAAPLVPLAGQQKVGCREFPKESTREG